MLISKRLFISTSKHVAIIYNKTSWKYHIKLTSGSIPAIFQAVAYSDRFTLLKSPLDPRVEKLQNQIKYSDYIEDKYHRLPYHKLKELQSQERQMLRNEKIHNVFSSPTVSVALKYLNVATPVENIQTPKTNEASTQSDPKPIYMPYAEEHEVTIFQDFSDKDVDNDDNEKDEESDYEKDDDVLNSKFKAKHEEMLNKINDEASFTRWRDNINTVPSGWMMDYAVFDESKLKSDTNEDPWMMKYGTPEPNSKITSYPCSGCGALLHCKDPAIPGYIPSELLIYRNERELRKFICQRCHFMKNYNVALDVKVSADEYPKLLQQIKTDKIKAVILMIDLMDFPCCIWPNLQEVIGNVPIILVGNKIDLLPQDSTSFFKNIKERMVEAVINAGIKKKNIIDIALISAKTHFGIEEMINKLLQLKKKGNVYLVGCTNVGKSSLFNALLHSDYCKIAAVDLVERATVAPWPGTTLNLLKFPIMKPIPSRLTKRIQRLISEKEEKYLEQEHLKNQYKSTRNIKFATLQSRIGRSFVKCENLVNESGKIVDIFEMKDRDDKQVDKKRLGLDEKSVDFKKSEWCFDTPGTIQSDQILHLLTTEELLHTLPKAIIMPRSFVIHANETLFLAGLGRIDILEACEILRCTVFASSDLPVTICSMENADQLYKELLRTEAFVVPVPDEERLKVWPEMNSKEFKILGINKNESAADIVLSSAGWVSITPKRNEAVRFRAWTPEGRGIYLRQPSLLKNSIALRGPRIRKTPAYKRTRIVFGTR